MFLSDNLMANGHSHTRSLTNRFCGEEWIKDFLASILSHASAVVGNGDLYPIGVDFGRRNCNFARGLLDLLERVVGSRFFQRINRIRQDVHEHLIELAGIAFYEWQIAIVTNYLNGWTLGVFFQTMLQN